jgi:hypothetical protein
MHKSATKCNETVGKWCKNKHGASKIIDTFETYHQARADIKPPQRPLQSPSINRIRTPPGCANFLVESALSADFTARFRSLRWARAPLSSLNIFLSLWRVYWYFCFAQSCIKTSITSSPEAADASNVSSRPSHLPLDAIDVLNHALEVTALCWTSSYLRRRPRTTGASPETTTCTHLIGISPEP